MLKSPRYSLCRQKVKFCVKKPLKGSCSNFEHFILKTIFSVKFEKLSLKVKTSSIYPSLKLCVLTSMLNWEEKALFVNLIEGILFLETNSAEKYDVFLMFHIKDFMHGKNMTFCLPEGYNTPLYFKRICKIVTDSVYKDVAT